LTLKIPLRLNRHSSELNEDSREDDRTNRLGRERRRRGTGIYEYTKTMAKKGASYKKWVNSK